MEDSLLDRLKRFDDERPGFPGEHWLALSAALWLLARPSASPLARALSIAAGLALVYRAASGRDGLAGWWSRTPWRRARARKAWTRDLDAFVPYSKRVRVAAISEPVGRSALMR